MKKRLFKIIAVALCLVLAMPAVSCTKTLSYSGAALPDGRAGVSYTAKVDTATGTDAAAITYALKEGESNKLPTGLTLSAKGEISGVTQQVGDFSFAIVASADKYKPAEATFTLKIAAKLNFSYNPTAPAGGTPLVGGIVGEAYTANVATAKGAEGITYAIKEGSNLPTGLRLEDGAIKGTPTATYTGSFIVVASATGYNDAEARFTLNIVLPSIFYPSSELAGGKVGITYTASVANVTVPNKGVKYMRISGDETFPDGLELNGTTGAITGTPKAAGTFNFKVRATADDYNYDDAEFTIEIVQLALSYTASALSNGQITIEYKDADGEAVTVATATAPEGNPAITYTRTGSGNLPGGLTLNSDGKIEGTPNAVGTFNFTVRARAEYYADVTANFSITIENLGGITYPTKPLPNGKIGEDYSESIATATAPGNPAITYVVTAGSLPTGLELIDGVITGKPTALVTNRTFTITASAAHYDSATADFSITITNLGTITYTYTPQPFPLPGGKITVEYKGVGGAAVSVGTATAPGNPTITYSRTAGSLPGGLTLSSGGTIEGTPNAVGTFNFTVTASAYNYTSATADFTIVIASILTYTGATLISGKLGVSYTADVGTAAAIGVTTQPAITYTRTAGSLPGGLTLGGDGKIEGTPNAEGTFNFTVTASADEYDSVSADFEITISEKDPVNFPTKPLPNGKIGEDYSESIATATAPGNPTIIYSTSSNLYGLTLSSNGTITGKPNAVRTISFTVTASAGAGYSDGVANFSIIVDNLGTISYTYTPQPYQLPDGKITEDYSQSIATATAPGSPAITYTVTTGSLPAGLGLVNGVITGKPTALGTNITFTVTASATNYTPASAQFRITIANLGAITYTYTPQPFPLQGGKVGTDYSVSVATATAPGNPPITYAITSGASQLNALGLSFNNGQITGKPTATGTATFTVTASATNYTSASASFTILISAADSIIFEPSDLSDGKITVLYSDTVATATAPGNPTITYSTSDNLYGLTLNPDGTITGTPNAVRTITFTVTASATGYASASAEFSITITNLGTITFTTAPTLPDGEKNKAYSEYVAATADGSPTITYTITGGDLSEEFELNSSTGEIKGTPTVSKTYTVIIRAVATNYTSATRTFTITIKDPTVNPAEEQIFEAEHTSFVGKVGVGISGTIEGTGMILNYAIPQGEGKDPSNKAATGWLFGSEIYFDFYIISDKDVDDAKLVIRLGNELNETIAGFDGKAFQLRVGVPTGEVGPGGHKIQYEDQTVIAWKGGPYTVPAQGLYVEFYDYYITDSLSLKKGVNVLSFEIIYNKLVEVDGTFECFGPVVDCFKITTSANLSWGVDPETGKPYPHNTDL